MGNGKILNWADYTRAAKGNADPADLDYDKKNLDFLNSKSEDDVDIWWGKPSKTTSGTASYKKCSHTHKPLKIGEYFIYGGACASPIVTDADIYVGFEHGMQTFNKNLPWVEGEAFEFLIVDMGVPPSVELFKGLLKYLSDSLIAGKKVHIGCIGGHGRTGLVLSALVRYMTNNKEAIQYVRDNYCVKAVESETQINWLNKHFGIDKVKPSKSSLGSSSIAKWGAVSSVPYSKGSSRTYAELAASKTSSPEGFTFIESVKPVRVKGSVWGF